MYSRSFAVARSRGIEMRVQVMNRVKISCGSRGGIGWTRVRSLIA